jgi:hypothetical protein
MPPHDGKLKSTLYIRGDSTSRPLEGQGIVREKRRGKPDRKRGLQCAAAHDYRTTGSLTMPSFIAFTDFHRSSSFIDP